MDQIIKTPAGDTAFANAFAQSTVVPIAITNLSSWGCHGANPRVRFRVSIEGQPPGPAHGLDVNERGDGTVVEQRFLSADPTVETNRRSNIRDGIPRCRRGGVRFHVRLTVMLARKRSLTSFLRSAKTEVARWHGLLIWSRRLCPQSPTANTDR
jgi:hypothetical protein